MMKKCFCVLLVLALLLPGCAKTKTGGVSESEASISQAATIDASKELTPVPTATPTPEPTPTPTPTPTPAPYAFKAHIHTDLLSEFITEEKWNVLYNLIDAIRAGEDSFMCTDEETYSWCTDSTVIGTFLPPACMYVVPDGYENGVGKIKYTISKEKYHEREAAFEEEVCRILNEAIRSDYSDFEKLMGLYEYVCRHFQYDYSSVDGVGVDEFSDYACIMTKKGICCEVAGAFSYLLLQCNVEAISIGSTGHDWNYVEIGGKGYHVDATWGLHGERPDDELSLRYFMMTEADRISDDFSKDDLKVDQLWVWKRDYDIGKFTATDETFEILRDWSYFVDMDTEKNVIRYRAGDTVAELNYGEM